MKTYTLIKYVILRGLYDDADMMEKLDVYLAADRITVEQYKELVGLVKEQSGGEDDTGAE